MSTDAAIAKMEANILKNTGRAVPEWVKLARGSGLEKHGQIVKWLKDEHALTHGYANLVAHKALKSDAGSAGAETDLVAAQYAGNKAGLRAIYDALARAVAKLGADVELAPKKAYVSLRRAKQFGLIQPSTATRVDVGLNLKGEPPTSRLEASGSFNAMVTHRVRVESVAEVDKELVGWLKLAYDRA
jgi:hypothetical protein